MLALLGGDWAALNLLELDPRPLYQVLWPLLTCLLEVFSCHSLWVARYHLTAFSDCEEAARELQAQAQEA